MSDTIDRQAAISAMTTTLWHYPTECLRHINKYEFAKGLAELGLKSVPSAQPETAKRIVGKSRNGMTLWYQCDMCNEPVDAQDNFCRGCGRRLIDE